MPKIIPWSVKPGKAIGFKEVLRYLLCPVPLSIVFPDGSKQLTAKSKLLKGVWVFQMPSFQTYYSKLMPIFSM